MASQTFINIGGYGLSWYLPTIVTNLGFAGLPRNQLLNIPPAAASVIAIIIAGWIMKRGWVTRPMLIIPILVPVVICFFLFFTISSRSGIYAALVVGTAFYSVYFIPFWACKSPLATPEPLQVCPSVRWR
jgi:hypothetical protein